MNRLEKLIDTIEYDGNTILRLKHAYRVNGNLDIYRRSYTLYIRSKNEYRKFNTEDEMIQAVKSIVTELPRVENFKQMKNGMGYREFKMQKYALKDSSHAEDYHWSVDDQFGEDHMYFVFHRDTAKIGRTKDIQNRLKQLKTALSHDYQVYIFRGKGHMEKKMHHVFSEFRTSREWFKRDYRMVRFANKYGTFIE